MLKRALHTSLIRPFTEEPFQNRWGTQSIQDKLIKSRYKDLPPFKPELSPSYRPIKDRVFDFEIPKDLEAWSPPIEVWSMADGWFSINQIWIPGSVVLTLNTVFSWHVENSKDIHEHTLDLVRFIRPRPEYVIVGTGKEGKAVIPHAISQRFKMMGVNLEYSATVRDI